MLTFTGDLYNTKLFDGSVLSPYNLIVNFEGTIAVESCPVEGKVNLSMEDIPLKNVFKQIPWLLILPIII